MSLVAHQFLDKQARKTLVPGLDSGRRKYRRVTLTLLGRFMRANKQEFPCRLLNISVGGISIISPVTVEEDECIVAYFDTIGSVQGTVARLFKDGFALRLKISAHKREKLAAELTWLINRDSFGTIDERRFERKAVANQQSILWLGDGFETKCRILNISLTGASLEVEARPNIGAQVRLGKQKAVVRRHHEKGIGVQFLKTEKPLVLERIN